jgi:hypothetical protein
MDCGLEHATVLILSSALEKVKEGGGRDEG